PPMRRLRRSAPPARAGTRAPAPDPVPASDTKSKADTETAEPGETDRTATAPARSPAPIHGRCADRGRVPARTGCRTPPADRSRGGRGPLRRRPTPDCAAARTTWSAVAPSRAPARESARGSPRPRWFARDVRKRSRAVSGAKARPRDPHVSAPLGPPLLIHELEQGNAVLPRDSEQILERADVQLLVLLEVALRDAAKLADAVAVEKDVGGQAHHFLIGQQEREEL